MDDRPVKWGVYLYSVVLCWVLACLARTYAESLSSKLLSVALFVGPLVPLLFPIGCTEVDLAGRRVVKYRKWLWGYGCRRVFSFDDIVGAEVVGQDPGEVYNPSVYKPRLVLRSGATVSLVQATKTKTEAEQIAETVNDALRDDADSRS